jgi:SAM-dependent methyltransferase
MRRRVHQWRYQLGRFRQSRRDRKRSSREVFSEVYRNNLWGGAKGEMYSGVGSRYAPAELYANAVVNFIKANDISNVVDLGCGDFEIGKRIAAFCERCVGVDVVPELIERNTKLYAAENIHFMCLDIADDDLPDGQLCLIRQVLQHLSNKEILTVLAKARKYPELIVTEHYPTHPESYNRDKIHGSGTRVEDGSGVYLDRPPYEVKNLKLLLEIAPMVLGEGSTPVTKSDWGMLRTFRVKL